MAEYGVTLAVITSAVLVAIGLLTNGVAGAVNRAASLIP